MGVLDHGAPVISLTRTTSPWYRWAPLAAAGVLYLLLVGVLALLAVRRTGGLFIYALDDPYIHLTVARTLADHGVWGISAEAFASVSSSPLWTVLLATVRLLGGEAIGWPLVINAVAGLIVLTIVDRVTVDSVEPPARFLLLIAITLAGPLPTLALVGMEHTLQTAFTVLLVWRAARHLSGQDDGLIATCIVAACLTGLRYEGLFPVFAVVCWMAWRGRWGAALSIGAAAAIPVVALGTYSVAHGALILPNSLLMKSGPSRFGTVSDGIAAVMADWFAVINIYQRPEQLVLAIAVLLLLVEAHVTARSITPVNRAFGALFLATVFLHASLVKLEWFYRYDAYLMVLGLTAVWLVAPGRQWMAERIGTRHRMPVYTLIALLALPLAMRALGAAAKTPAASANVYEQQYQLGLFFRRFYPDATIGINDIGAVSWLGPSRIFDIAGLASQDVTETWRKGEMTAATLERLARSHDVKAVAMYVTVFHRIVPGSWHPVGEWRIRDRVSVSEDTVVFLARSAEDAAKLQGALEAFSSALPEGVEFRLLRSGLSPAAPGRP